MGWRSLDETEALYGLRLAHDMGCTMFDTADVYGHGRSERLVGRLIETVSRDRLIVGSKVGYFSGTAPNAYHPLHIRHQLEMTLTNLKTDYLDIYYVHNFNFGPHDEYLDRVIETFASLKQKGLIRAIGLRGPHRFAPDRHLSPDQRQDKYAKFFAVASLLDPDVIQLRYNILSESTRRPRPDIIAWAAERNLGIIVNKPFAQGLLLDKYDETSFPTFEPGDHRRRKRWFSQDCIRMLKPRLEALKNYFGGVENCLVRAAVQYALRRSQNIAVLAGFSTAKQVLGNFAPQIGEPISSADLEYIDKTFAGVADEIGDYFWSESLDHSKVKE